MIPEIKIYRLKFSLERYSNNGIDIKLTRLPVTKYELAALIHLSAQRDPKVKQCEDSLVTAADYVAFPLIPPDTPDKAEYLRVDVASTTIANVMVSFDMAYQMLPAEGEKVPSLDENDPIVRHYRILQERCNWDETMFTRMLAIGLIDCKERAMEALGQAIRQCGEDGVVLRDK